MSVTEQDLEKVFLSVPGGDLVDKLIAQFQAVPQMVKIFGDKNGSWANYNRMDWPVRMLPAINIFESGAEAQTSTNGYLTGTLQVQVYWPSEFRREDLARIPNYFKGALESFFSSKYITPMLDEYFTHVRPEKVLGLNELGRTLSWSPNVEGLTDGDLVPMTIMDVQYRIDLRAWERALEFEGRTRDDPFEVTLAALEGLSGELDGVNNDRETVVVVPTDFVTNNGD